VQQDDEEEQALRDAVQKHGIGAWEKMRHDQEFRVLKCVAQDRDPRPPSPAKRPPPLPPAFPMLYAAGCRILNQGLGVQSVRRFSRAHLGEGHVRARG
jgi:hypothetical protein